VFDNRVTSGITVATDVLDMLRSQLQRFSVSSDAEAGTSGPAVPLVGLSAGPAQVPTSDSDQEQNLAVFGLSARASASVAGVVVAAGFVTWAIRAAGLLSTMLLSMPVWRSVDPLPILAPEDDRPRWKTDTEQEREEAAMAALWNARADADADSEEEMR